MTMPADSISRRLIDLPPERGPQAAFHSSAGSLSFAQLREGMLGMAGWLTHEAGVGPASRVAVYR